MKRLSWWLYAGVLWTMHRTWGAFWRRVVRPRSDALLSVTRLLRALLWCHRFDRMGARCSIGKNLRIWGPIRVFLGEQCALLDDVILCGVGSLYIGNGSSIGHNSVIVTREKIEVGQNVMIAGFCYLLDVDHEYGRPDLPIRNQGLRIAPVTIGDDVWIGAHSVILRGVRIGKGAVIGASSLVNRDVPEYGIAVGVPARLIGTRGVAPARENSGSEVGSCPERRVGSEYYVGRH